MNTQLYNSLVQAYEVLEKEEKLAKKISILESDIQWLKIGGLKHELQKLTKSLKLPKQPAPKPIKWGVVLFLLVVFFPLAIVYVLMINSSNNSNRQNYEKKLNDMQKSPEYISRVNEVKKKVSNEINEKEAELNRLLEEKQALKQSNKKYLDVIPWNYDCYRTRENVLGLLHYVRTGQADNIYMACELYARELRDEWQRIEHKEEIEELKRMHNEKINKLNEISKNQEKIKDELEYANRYRSINHY